MRAVLSGATTRSWGTVAARTAGVATTVVLAGVTTGLGPRPGVLVLGLLAVALAVLAGLQVVATRLPALVVVLLAAQFLAACSGPVTPGQIAWTALEAAALWAVHGCFGLGDVVARATDVRSSALRRCVWRTLSISLVATPLVVIVIVLGHAGRDESWLRVAGPLAALAALGALAAQLRLTRWRRNR